MWAFDRIGTEEPPRIMIATPHMGFTPYEFAAGLRACNIPFETRIIGQKGGSIDVARNMMVTRALQEKCTHIFFVDSDIRLEPDTFTKLFDSSFPVVSGLYKSRSPPFALTAKQNGVAISEDVLNWQNAANIGVSEVPAGCLLVDIRVIHRIASFINEWQCFIDHREDGAEVLVFSDKEARDQNWKCKKCDRNLVSYFFQDNLGKKGIKKHAVSEDYYFSNTITSIGLPIYVRNDAFVEHYSGLGDWFISRHGPATTTSMTGLAG